jgi:hypothetical protein
MKLEGIFENRGFIVSSNDTTRFAGNADNCGPDASKCNPTRITGRTALILACSNGGQFSPRQLAVPETALRDLLPEVEPGIFQPQEGTMVAIRTEATPHYGTLISSPLHERPC